MGLNLDLHLARANRVSPGKSQKKTCQYWLPQSPNYELTFFVLNSPFFAGDVHKSAGDREDSAASGGGDC